MDLMRRRPTLPKIDEQLTVSLSETKEEDQNDAFFIQDTEVTSRIETHTEGGWNVKSESSNCFQSSQTFENNSCFEKCACVNLKSPRTPNGRGIPKSFSFNGFQKNCKQESPERSSKYAFDLDSDMAMLKAKANQLNLQTRRPSYVAWRQQVLAGGLPVVESDKHAKCIRTLEETTSRISTSLDWIRKELEYMRTEDQNLARTFLKLRSDIHDLKLKWSCEDHKVMIEDTQDDLEDIRMLQMICDRPVDSLGNYHLRKLGVTKMNITSRRFSTC